MIGELSALSAAFLWAAASILFARAGARTGPVPLNLVKTAAGWLLTVLTVALVPGAVWPAGLASGDLGWLAVSGVLGLTVGDSLFFGALNRLGARRAMLLWALVPPLTALLAWPMLGEVLGLGALVGASVTLAGVAWVLNERRAGPGQAAGASIGAGLALGLGAVFCQSFGSVTAKLGGAALDGVTLSVVRLTFGLGGLVLQVCLQRAFGEVRALLAAPRVLGGVLLATFIGTYLGLWLSMVALQATHAAIAAVLTATSPIFVLPLSRIFLKEPLSLRAVLGASVALLGVAILVAT